MKKLPTLTRVLAALLLTIVCVSVAWAWPDETAAPVENSAQPATEKEVKESNSEAVELLRQARNRLFERQSVQARLSQTVNLGAYRFQSQGNYSAAAGFRYRLEYQVALGDLRGEFLEVCDGQVLHTRRQIAEAQPGLISMKTPEIELTRRDIQKIRREVLGLRDSQPETNLEDAIRAAEIGVGGIPAMLAMLEKSLILDPLRPQTIEGRAYFIVQGEMRPDQKGTLLAGLGGAAGQVAGFLPDLVRLYIAQDTLFPERFLYLKSTPDDPEKLRPLMTVEFSDIVLDQPLAESLFIYMAPPGLEERDETAQFLDAMRQAAGVKPVAPEQEQKQE